MNVQCTMYIIIFIYRPPSILLYQTCANVCISIHLSYRLWQELGYLIIYITGRPDIQKEYVTSWLGLHGFPMGVVSFSDSLSTDPNNIKLLYLARLIKDVSVWLMI